MGGQDYMNQELKYIKNPRRQRIVWSAVYIIIGLVTLFGLYKAASRIKTHSLPVGQIQLSIPFSKYLNGEVITFTIKNNFNSPIYITNECPAEPLNVYQQEGGKWVRIHDTASLKDCSKEARQVLVPANGSVSGNFAPWHHLFNKPGKYRVVVSIEFYDSLPYQDFEIINAPAKKAVAKPKTTVGSSTKATAKTSTPAKKTTQEDGGDSTSQNPPSQPVTPKTYTISVNSAGNYSITSLTINAGDSINFVYSPCCSGEVRTRFTPISPTTATLSSLTLDSEFTSRTRTFTTKGTWRFKADDHSGNTGTLIVN